MKHFAKNLLDHEIFRSMVSWATKLFLKNLFLKKAFLLGVFRKVRTLRIHILDPPTTVRAHTILPYTSSP